MTTTTEALLSGAKTTPADEEAAWRILEDRAGAPIEELLFAEAVFMDLNTRLGSIEGLKALHLIRSHIPAGA